MKRRRESAEEKDSRPRSYFRPLSASELKEIDHVIDVSEQNNERILIFGHSNYDDAINWYYLLSSNDVIVLTLDNGNMMSALVSFKEIEQTPGIGLELDFIRIHFLVSFNRWQVVNRQIQDNIADISEFSIVTGGNLGINEMSIRGNQDRYNIVKVEINSTQEEVKDEVISILSDVFDSKHLAEQIYYSSGMQNMSRIVSKRKRKKQKK